VMEVLPLVPVTPMVASRSAGRPWTSAAAAAVARRGSSTTSTGRPADSQRSRPSASVSAIAAPSAAACSANCAPWALAPGSAHQRSPRSTERESSVTPRSTVSAPSPGTVGAGAPRARASSAAEAPTARRGRAGSRAGSVMEVIVGSPLVLPLTTGHAGGGDALVLEGEGGQLREGGCRRRGRAGPGAGSVLEAIVGSPLVPPRTTGPAGGGEGPVLEGEGGQRREGGCRRAAAGDEGVQSEHEHADHALRVVRRGEADEGG